MSITKRLALISSSAILLAACNQTTQYVSGPWGHGYVSDTGPRYSSPWNSGPLVIVQPNEFIDAGGVSPSVTDVTPEAFRANVGVPPQPAVPTSEGMPVTTLDTGPVPGSPDVNIAIASQTAPEQPQATYTPPPQRQAAISKDPAPIPAPTRPSSYAGAWTITDASGKRCRITLSTTSVVDRYRASTSGCSSAALQGVNTWTFNGENITLHARESEVARLNGKTAHMNGTIQSEGTSIRMTR